MYKVIVVDDERTIREGIVHLTDWQRHDCMVTGSFGSAREALSYLELNQADIVITDIRMPGMDGLELCRRINETYPAIRCIVLTAYSDFSYARQALRNGVSDYIVKNEFLEELPKALERCEGSLTAGEKKYCVVSGRLETSGPEKNDIERTLDHILTLCLVNAEFRLTLDGTDCSIFITCDESAAVDAASLKGNFSAVVLMVQEFLGCSMQFGIGSFVSQLSDMPLSLQQSRIALEESAAGPATVLVYEKKEQLVQKIERYLASHYAEDVNLTAMSSELNYSTSYLSRKYKELSGTTITEKLTEIRMEQACRLLTQDGSMKIYEIAEQVGISDPAYFTNTFMKYKGMSPSEYKKSQEK
ncbi:MAG: response regulator [Treponemataceae bacterium]|nr:response regulator [Treponemataceae bacterium]